VMTERLALMDVRDVTLNQRRADTLDGVVQSGRRVREGPGIEHRADRLPGLDRRSLYRLPRPLSRDARVGSSTFPASGTAVATLIMTAPQRHGGGPRHKRIAPVS
jgi:hypothetical protein